MKEKQIGEYTISTDKSKLDIDTIHDFLCNHSYWAKGISRQMVEKLNKHCMVVGIYHGLTQVGYARVITDFASFAYLSDVFIVENHRKKGLSKQLIQLFWSMKSCRVTPLYAGYTRCSFFIRIFRF
jgi:predicted acetyltransferase